MLYRYFIKISFDGTNYNGWQVQKNSSQTVQQKINDGLSKLLGEKIEVQGCCRTDAGVHAKELFAHFDTQRNLTPCPSPQGEGLGKGGEGRRGAVDWLYKFSNMIPLDISIDGIYSVNEKANARYDATARTYQYFIHQKRNPFLINRSYYYYSELDVALMNKAAKLLKKYDDFSAFSKVNTQVKTNICKIYKAEWEYAPTLSDKKYGLSDQRYGVRIPSDRLSAEKGEKNKYSNTKALFRAGGETLIFTIRANRFLRGMVRMIVGTMMLLGKNKITLSDFKKIIESKNCQNAGALAPACGLYLTKVEYPAPTLSDKKYGLSDQRYGVRIPSDRLSAEKGERNTNDQNKAKTVFV